MKQIPSEVLEMALIGYQVHSAKITAKIAEVDAMLRGKRRAKVPKPGDDPILGTTPDMVVRRKRKLTAAGRKAIREALRRRWAKVRRQKSGLKTVGRKKREA